MYGQDLFVTVKDERGGNFRHGTSKREELLLKKELDDLARKTIGELSSKKEIKKTIPLSESEITARKLRPEFVKSKLKEKRKTEPMFPAEMRSKTPKQQYSLIPNVPPYNPLDKGPSAEIHERTKKFPYAREDTITTTDMKKAHISSVGVVPTVRDSVDISDLKVLLEGRPVAATEDASIDQIAKANVSSPVISSRPPSGVKTKQTDKGLVIDAGQKSETIGKPAILGSVGTIQPVLFSIRQKPQQRSKSQLDTRQSPRRIRSAGSALSRGKSAGSSLRSADIVLPDDHGYSDALRDSEVQTAISGAGKPKMVEEDRKSVASSTGTVKSVKELVDEAKQIASPEAQPLYRKHLPSREREKVNKRTTLRDAVRKDGRKDSKRVWGKGDKSKVRGTSRDEDEKQGRPRTERSVDEIIASLRNQSGSKAINESDRKIQEIMDRVMFRAVGVEEASPRVDAEQDPEPQALSEDKPGEFAVMAGQESGVSITITTEENETMKFDTSEPKPPAQLSPLAMEAEQRQDTLSEDEPDDEEMASITKAWDDLMAPPVATYEDLVGIKGQTAGIQERNLHARPDIRQKPPVYSNTVSFLSSWQPAVQREKFEPQKAEKSIKNVHHFCTMTSEFQLPKQFQGIGRKYHTPSKYEKFYPEQIYRFDSGFFRDPEPSSPVAEVSEVSLVDESEEDVQRRLSAAADRILNDGGSSSEPESLEAWQQKAATVFDKPDMVIEGTKMAMKADEPCLYWTPAPPKLDVPPAKVRDALFPDYHGISVGMEIPIHQKLIEFDEETESEDEEELQELDADDRQITENILSRQYHSSRDISGLMLATMQRDEDIKAGKINPYIEMKEERQFVFTPSESSDPKSRTMTPRPKVSKMLTNMSAVTGSDSDTLMPLPTSKPVSILEMRRKFSEAATVALPSETNIQEEDILPVFVPLRRSKSEPSLTEGDDETLIIPQDFSTAMEEILKQKDAIKDLRLKKKQDAKMEDAEEVLSEPPDESNLDLLASVAVKTQVELTAAEKSLEAGRSYVILPKKKKKKPKVYIGRMERVSKFLRKPANKLKRSNSMPRLLRPVERDLRVPQRVRSNRRNSIPEVLNFVDYTKKKRMPPSEDIREWVRAIWNKWFDRVFPPTPSDSEAEEDDPVDDMEDIPITKKEEKVVKGWDSVSAIVSDLDSIEPLEDNEENRGITEILLEEIEKLTRDINAAENPKAYDHCRRGAIYRKIGKFKKALDDLNKAIEMEPMLLDAYWHRHLLYLLQSKHTSAIEDLNFVLRHNKYHAGSYRSMAEIYAKQGNITMAIVNYSQALKLNPQDHEAFYRRAQMYEQRGDMRLALEDYGKSTKIMPTKTDAMLKRGLYYFEHGMWNNAVSDFTDMLGVEPTSALARTYRGRALAKMNKWTPAVQDLSAAIHFDPNSWLAFYHRGCLLRKMHPMRALQDFSMSLLINDSDENIMSFLHRGIVYNDTERPDDAILDFESVLKLNQNIACAHVNLGLIYMKNHQNNIRAIKKFSSAIKVDPTYVRAYVCRGEAYHKINDLHAALADFNRAIHLAPDVHHYYMYRGQLVLKLGNHELAAFCVRHAAELNQEAGLGQRPTQQAVVQSFLKNYDQAIEALLAAVRSRPVPQLFMLLGNTQIKAKQFREAITSFGSALELYKPWAKREPWPQEASVAHFLIGSCHTELRNYLEAHDAYNNAIKIDPNYAEAFYQRGLARMRLKQSKGIQDFNRALALNPKIFQAYLSRACYYGLRTNYTKAILNCNEAIKLQPNSVRAYLYRGSLKYYIKAYDLAIQDLTKAAMIDSTCGLAFFNRAVCYQEHKEYSKALMDYGIVLLLGDQLMLKVLINRGLLYFERKDYSNALYDFLMASQLCPWDHRIHHTLGLCYHKLDQLPAAIKSFSMCLHQSQFFLDGLISRGNVFMDYGHEQGLKYARRDYERALILDPVCLPARVNLAYTLQVQGKLMQAWRQFSTAIQMNPTYKPALEGRAIVCLQMSDTFAAFQDINASIKVSPTAELMTNRGVINQFMHDSVNAMRDYQTAIKLDATYSLAYFNAANIYFHTRHFQQALSYYDQALEHNPKDESAYLNRAITKVMLRDAPGALEDFKAAIKLSPYSAHVYLNRGNLYASLQNPEKAERDYSKALSLDPDDALVLKRRADVRGKLGKRELAIADYKRAVEIQGRPKPFSKQPQRV